ncbi:endolytic transglycosylase MltG [Candidatus Peregrinibacteria bacterium]|nr:endolytic transglycosylase MltG [Candidatus Peregrinibacteria bacterium]
MRKFLYLLVVIVIAFIFFGYSYYSGAISYSKNPISEDRIVITIDKGQSADSVAQMLADKELIKSSYVFKLYLKQKGLASDIKAGRIVLLENYKLPEIIDALVKGGTSEVPITLLEGWTIAQIGQYLEDANFTTAEEFIECTKTCEFDFDFIPEDYLEGYLYPDTYFVESANFSSEGLISRMISTFENKLDDEDWEAISKSEKSLEEIIIMASIVEREERSSSERATVAGILWNRFDAGIGLGADATVLYALGRTKGGLTYQDLQVNSPYNTRKYRGLPPTPICNPSISSIRAALYPKKTNYWYYLHDSDGGVHYAETLDGHNANKAMYIN